MAATFVPVEQEQMAGWGRLSPQVQWYVLIRDMEAYRRETGWGLAATWGLVHEGNYEAARTRMNFLLEERRGAAGTA
jgi:hypothetical protein